MERSCPRIRDGHGEITTTGKQIHELVRVDQLIKQSLNPEVEFAMSKPYLVQCAERRQELFGELGIKKKQRERRIGQFKEALVREGVLYSKAIDNPL